MIAVFCQTLLDHKIMRGRQMRIDTAGHGRFFINNLEHHRGGVAGEGFLPRQHGEDHNAQGEDVRARVNFAAPHLFR